MRKMGNLVNFLPVTYVCFVIGSLSLMAFPFLTGFYSKDFILEILFIPNNTTQTIAYLLTLVAAFLTSIYSIRLLILTFLSKPHFNNKLSDSIHDPLDFPTMFTFIVLAMGSILFGYFAQELFVGGGTEIYMNSLFTHPNNFRLFDSSLSEFTIYKLFVSLPLIFIISLLPLKKELTIKTPNIMPSKETVPTKDAVPLYWMTRILSHFNILNHWIMHNSLNHSINLFRYFDRGLLQFVGPHGLYRNLNFHSFKLEMYYTGFIIHYAFLMIAALLTIIMSSYTFLLLLFLLIISQSSVSLR